MGWARWFESNARNARPVVGSHFGFFTETSGEAGRGARRSAFLAFAQALEQALAEQKLCDLEVLENQSYQRIMPPCSYLGSDLNMCKVVIEGFLPSNADPKSGAPHLLQILAKIDPNIARNAPKLLRPPRDLVMDEDAACVADKVTATTILSASVATAWWEEHHI